jgi:hypothetical protein
MTEKDLIQNLKGLRQEKPNQEWVSLTRQRIFSQEPEEQKMDFVLFTPFFRYKLAMAPVIAVLTIIGLFGFAQNTTPGNFFFQFKKVTETAQVSLSSGAEKSSAYVRLANKRLEELNQIAGTSQVQNLSQTIKEFQTNITEATKNLSAMDVNADSDAIKEFVAETRKLEENRLKVETVLGAKVGDTQEFESALLQLEKQMAEYLIIDLDSRTLSEGDQTLLTEAKTYFEAGDYSQSLEKIWLLSNKY